jgi:uncharacterized membrane protein YsdA (DUF1294 family)
MERVIFFYFLFINLVTFFIYAYDKLVSQYSKKRRISEKELHTFAIIGGFLGATLAMALLRHKVSKRSFLLKHIGILFIWVALIIYYFTQLNTLNFVS